MARQAGRYMTAVYQRVVAEREAAEAEAARIAQEEVEAELAAEQARVAYRPPSGPQTALLADGSYPPECYGKVLPAYIVWRESRCQYQTTNDDGFYQIIGMHWAPNALCGDLDRFSPAGQDACAWRLSQGGANLDPWRATR